MIPKRVSDEPVSLGWRYGFEMRDWAVPLSDIRFSEAEVQAVAEAYRSGWLSQGPRVAAFEQKAATYFGSRHAIAVSSGTAALQLICAGMGLGRNDEVIVPSLTFAATAACVVHAGATPVFADVGGIHAPWLTAASVEERLSDRTRAVITVSYGGHPGDINAVRETADRVGIPLMEDAAHAIGTRTPWGYLGTIGDAGAFSFFSNKNLPLGEGGMVLTSDDNLSARLRLLRSHGLTSGTWERHSGAADSYDVAEPGFNFRLDEPRAALATMLLARLESGNECRRKLAGEYERALESIEGASPVLSSLLAPGASFHIYPVVLDTDISRAEVRASLAAAGIQTTVHYPPLHRTSGFARFGPASLPLTEEYARRTLTLPLFPHMTDGQHERVCAALASAITAARPGGR